MQSQPPKQFRFSRQWAIIVIVTLLALIVPMACVVLAVKDIFKPRPEETVSAMPLQIALEDIASKKLNPPPLAGGDERVELTAVDPLKEGGRIETLAKRFDGMALPGMPEGDGLRMVVQLPKGRVPSFIAACHQPDQVIKGDSSRPAGNDQARVLVEIVIAKTSP